MSTWHCVKVARKTLRRSSVNGVFHYPIFTATPSGELLKEGIGPVRVCVAHRNRPPPELAARGLRSTHAAVASLAQGRSRSLSTSQDSLYACHRAATDRKLSCVRRLPKRQLCRINLATHESACGVRDLAGRGGPGERFGALLLAPPLESEGRRVATKRPYTGIGHAQHGADC